MGSGVRIIINRSKKKRVSRKVHGSDDSDEDYVLDEDQEPNASEGFCASADDPSEENIGLVDEDVSFDEVEKKRVGRSKTSKLRNDESLEIKRTRIRQPSKRARVSDDEEEDYEFDDENDEEFMPDEIDCVDEEEDLQVEERANKVKKCIRRKVSETRQKTRKTKVLKKPSKKKPRKKSENSDDDFIAGHKVLLEISKKKTKIRTKKRCIDWDSDSDCSEPPDLEYTISEEEKELLKEANTFCGISKPCLRNSSMPKRLHVDVAPNSQQHNPIGRKGKSKVSGILKDSGKQVCGICLSEEGKETVQGTLNCCSHYFCFSCIMEWSKVESRCPLCKQRFVSITKPARTNLAIDLRNAVIQVPKRDQVYRPTEEEVRGYFDPYENVPCIECHQVGHDSLMLLCDLCDSAAHTYCVGLGQEVPEGNWFCKGCSDIETVSNLVDPVLDHGRNDFGFASDLSTHGISAEGIGSPAQHSVSVVEPSFSQLFENFPSPRYPILEDVHAVSPSGIGASTLSGRRRVYRHMHDIRSSNRAERFSRATTEETSFQHGLPLTSNGLHTIFESREQDGDSCLLEGEELVSARFNFLRRLTPGSSAAVASTSFTTSCPEVERTNVIDF